MILRLPTILSAIEFRRHEYGWNQKQMAKALGISDSRYSEFVNGKRRLTYAALCKAFEIGVPPDVLLQTPKTRREYEKRQHNDVPSEELKQP